MYSYEQKKEARYSKQELEEITAALKGASKDQGTITEMEWRERVFSKLLEPLSKKFTSNACDTQVLLLHNLTVGRSFALPLLTPGKRRVEKGRSPRNSYMPDKVFAQWCAVVSCNLAP